MRKILTLSALAMLLAGPAFAQAGDIDLQDERAWQAVVAQANANRIAAMSAPVARLAASDAAVSSATDAASSAAKPSRDLAPIRNGFYPNTLSILQDK